MLEGLAPDLGPRLLLAVGGVALALIALIAVLIFLKKRNSPLFIKGGRSREHRLHVLDAAAVDARRRLVLIRRDETEHLIMIGGPTDIVIETCINDRLAGRAHLQAKAEIAQDEELALPRVIANEQPKAPTMADPLAVEQQSAQRQAASRAATHQAAPVTQQRAPISSAGAMLYENEGGADTRPPSLSAQTAAAQQKSAGAQSSSLATQAEDILDNARNRVLTPPQTSVAQPLQSNSERVRQEVLRAEQARQEAQKAEAQRLEAQRAEAIRAEQQKAELQRAAEAQRQEAARAEAMRQEALRKQAQDRLAQEKLAQERQLQESRDAARREPSFGQTAGGEQTERAPIAAAPPADPARQEKLASDFAELLENELEAGGIFESTGSKNPEVGGNFRDPQPGFRNPAPAITGASPQPSTEQELARRLAEAGLGRKTDPTL